MLALCITVAGVSLVIVGYALSVLKAANRDIREIATEAILSSRAQNAEELAQASAYAHQMKLERQAAVAPIPTTATRQPSDPDKVALADGTILNVLRPFG